MSHPHDLTPPEAEKFDPKHAGSLPKNLLLAGAAGILLSLIGLAVPSWREQFAFSWLFAFFFFFSICIGCLFWTCLHHASDSDWSVLVRRQLENVASLIPYFVLFFLPILACTSYLFKWWDLAPGADPLLDAKQGYLNHTFFYVRAAFYFSLLTLIALSLKKRSIAQDKDGSVSHSLMMRKLGVGGIPAVAIGITFSGIDWLMGLDFHWFSTMWGVYLFAGAAGSSMSLLVIIVSALKRRGYLSVVNEEHFHTMGKYMLAFSIFWAYIGFSQYMLIWYANIPEETIYFRIRNTGGWWYLSTLLVVGRFFLPFPVLLMQATKKAPQYLCAIAFWIIGMQLLDMYVIVLPALHETGLSPSLLDIFPLIGMGGILGWLFFRNLGKSYLFPTRDPRLAASLKLTN
ncbi:MAG: hypothetical protein JWL59_1065 [Chthoniobacteraceae bacterium]|nr:hypothetical protein [Chthoniobacteraceae bacterium]